MVLRRIRVGCEFTYVAAVNTPVIFQVQPGASRENAIETERWTSTPSMSSRGYSDLYGNPCIRAVLPVGRSTFGYDAVVACPDATEDADPAAAALESQLESLVETD